MPLLTPSGEQGPMDTYIIYAGTIMSAVSTRTQDSQYIWKKQ